jgi:hypothetical protein
MRRSAIVGFTSVGPMTAPGRKVAGAFCGDSAVVAGWGGFGALPIVSGCG